MKKNLLLFGFIVFIFNFASAQFAQQWVKTFDDSLHQSNEAAALTLNNSGCIIVTGTTYDTAQAIYHIQTIKYDASGNVLWQVLYQSSYNALSTAITTDASGNIFITADILDTTINRIHVLKYNCSGSLVWDAVYPVVNTYVNLSKRISLDGSGNIYVGATSDCWSCYSLTQSNFGEATIVKFDSNGNYMTEMRTGNIFTTQHISTWLNFLNDMEIVANKNIYSITNIMQDHLPNTSSYPALMAAIFFGGILSFRWYHLLQCQNHQYQDSYWC